MYLKKTLVLIIASAMLTGAVCSCSSEDSDVPISSIEEVREEYSIKLISENLEGVPDLAVSYEFKDGEDSSEVYYISFGCDVDGLLVERVDESGVSTQTLYQAESIGADQCFKLITTIPEGAPNTRISAICGESEYRYLLSYDGQNGGAYLISEN